MSVELVNPDIDRVDAVNGPATGIPFLLFKSADGAPAEPAAEESVEKSAEQPAEAPEETVEKAAEPEAPAEGAEPAEEPVAKSEEDAAEAPELAPDDLAKAHVLKSLAFELKKGAVASLPTGLLELLGEVVAAYQQVIETGDTAPESPADAEAPAPEAAPPAAPEEAEAMEEAAEPVEDALVEDAKEEAAPPAPPAKAEAPAPAPPAPEEKAAAPAPAPAPPAPAKQAPPAPAAPAAPAEEEEVKKPSFAKSMEALILDAVAKATAPLLEANEQLAKRLEIVEATPGDSGPFLAGQTPGNVGLPSLRGQDVGGAAEGLVKSAAPQPPSGMDALSAALVQKWTGQ